MNRYVFPVGADAYCCWEYDLLERNEQFLAQLDTGYFAYVAERFGPELEGEQAQRAAVALRASYHHALETLFSLLCALAQAPIAVPAWLPNCSTGTLRKLVRALLNGEPILTHDGPAALTLEDISTAVHQYAWQDEEPRGTTAQRYGRFWRRVSRDFLDDRQIAEHNSLKHGFRVSSGGFTLRIGREESYGERPPETAMRTIGSSPFGSRFFECQPVVEGPPGRYHLRIRRSALNWRAEAMRDRLQLLSWSINNVVAALRCLTGAPPGTVQFLRPADPEAFEDVWRWPVGVWHSNVDAIIPRDEINPVPRAILLNELQARRSAGNEAEG